MEINRQDQGLRKSYLLFIMTLLLGICVYFAASGVFSYLSNTSGSEITITAGNVGVALVEDFPENVSETGVENHNEKTFWGAATGTKDSVVRALIIPMIEYKDKKTGEWVTYGGKYLTEGVDYKITDSTKSSWTKPEGSTYWYYNKVVKGNANKDANIGKEWKNDESMTSKFEIRDVKLELNKSDLPEDLQDAAFRLNMLVKIESSQSSNGLVIDNWGLTGAEADFVSKIAPVK